MATQIKQTPSWYKLTELWVIPNDWKIMSLWKIFEIWSSKRVFQSERKESWIPFYRAREIAILWEKWKVDNELFIDNELYLKYSRWYGIPSIWDMLVTWVWTLWKTYLVWDDKSFYFKDWNIIWFKISKSKILNANFLNQLFKTSAIEKQIEDMSAGSTVGTYTITWAKKTIIPLPPLHEQTAIATALSDVDQLITSLEKKIAKKEAIKLGTMHLLLTGKKRLPGFTEEWEERKLGEMLQYEQPTKYLVQNTDYLTSWIPVLTAWKSLLLWFTDENFWIYTELPVIIFDDFTTASKLIDYPFKVKSSAMKMLKPISKEFNIQFIYSRMQLVKFIMSDHKRYWISEYQNIILTVPAIEEQNAIAQVIHDIDIEITALKNKKFKYEKIKQWMMQQLLTGKIRLV